MPLYVAVHIIMNSMVEWENLKVSLGTTDSIEYKISERMPIVQRYLIT